MFIVIRVSSFVFCLLGMAFGNKCADELSNCEIERDETIKTANNAISTLCSAWGKYVECLETAKSFCSEDSYVKKSMEFFRKKIQKSCNTADKCTDDESKCSNPLVQIVNNMEEADKSNPYKTCPHFMKFLDCQSSYEQRCKPGLTDNAGFGFLYNISKRYCDHILESYPFETCENFTRCSKPVSLSAISLSSAINNSYWCSYLQRSLTCAKAASYDKKCKMSRNEAMKLDIHILLRSKLRDVCPKNAGIFIEDNIGNTSSSVASLKAIFLFNIMCAYVNFYAFY